MRLKTTLLTFFLIACFQQIYAQGCGADFEEVNGLAVFELDAKTAGSWERRSDGTASGGQALYYNGSDSFNSPPGNSVITYSIKVNTPGTYRVIVRNKIGITSSGTTEHNDVWLKVNGSEFFGRLGSSVVWPIGSGRTPNPEGASGNGYLKVYTNTFGWNWTSFTDDSGGHFLYATFPNAGVYTIQMGGRSNGFMVDKIALYLESNVGAGTAQSAGSTACDGSAPPPPPPPPPPTPTNNVAPTVSITSPSNGQNFDTGSNITVNLTSNDSDGSISSHKISVNGALVDTDGTTYSPHQLSNLQPGSYSISATVTDNSGATGTSTVNITVDEGGSTPPPPPPPPTPTPTENAAPSVSITSPSNGQNFDTGSNISINLTANDSDGNITTHKISVNGTLVDTDGVSYTPHPLTNLQPGSYSISATVTDNSGATATSTVNITVDEGDDTTPPPPPPPSPSENAAPTVSFTELANGDQVAPGSTVFVKVAASDSDGTIVKYQVWVNGKLVDTDGANYTPHPITSIASGDYVIKVEVTDNIGATGSATVTISAGTGTPPPPAGSDIAFDLINATTNVSIGALVDGATVSSSKTQAINIRVNAPANTAKVGVEIYGNGELLRQGFESFAPYSVFGDTEGNYNAWNLSNGPHRLVAAAYSSTGQLIMSKTIEFTVGSGSGKSAFLFPNPVKTDGRVSVRLPEGSSGKFEYNVTNSLGVQVERGTFNASSSQRDVQLSMPNIGRQVQGVYYMTLRSAGSRETIPLIRE